MVVLGIAGACQKRVSKEILGVLKGNADVTYAVAKVHLLVPLV